MKKFKVIISHTADPNYPTLGGAVKYSLNLLHFLSDFNIETSYLGVQLIKNFSCSNEKYNFIPIIKGSDKWYW
jgi:hypothetical protein